jgi:vancomycin resistance protein YoaR
MTEWTAPRPDHHRFPFGKLLLGVLAGFVLAFGFGAGALLAYQGQYADRIYPGVTVDGVDVAGLTREAAAATLERDLAGYSDGAATLVVDGTELQIPYLALGRRADVATLVGLAWSVGRSNDDAVGRATQGVRSLLDGTAIEPLVILDAEAVGREVARAAGAVDQAPVSGTATVTKAGFETTPAAAGRALPREEVAQELVELLADPTAPPAVEITVDAVPVEPTVTDEDVADAVLAASRMAREVRLAHGEESWKIGVATVRGWITFAETLTGVYAPSVAPDAATKSLANLAKKIDKAPRDARFLVGRNAGAVGVVAAKNGRALDVEASAALVADALNARAVTVSTDAPPPVEVAIASVKPKLTTEEAEKAAPRMKRLSRWTTYYDVSERNGYASNISIPTRDINGYVVAPGAVFDFWKAVGPVTYERGYRDGGAILNGRTEPTGALAGGICSCSTTLFNAAARAGLEILSRDNHYYYISRYPTGLDATVWKGGSSQQSMRFRNDTKSPILVRGIASPGVVTFEIWGPPTGRTVSFSRPTIRNVTRAIDTVQYTSSLRPGVRQRIEYPVNGMQVWVTRIVRDKNGKLVHNDTWYSDYKRVNGIVLVGKGAPTSSKPKPDPKPKPSPTPAPTPAPVP